MIFEGMYEKQFKLFFFIRWNVTTLWAMCLEWFLSLEWAMCLEWFLSLEFVWIFVFLGQRFSYGQRLKSIHMLIGWKLKHFCMDAHVCNRWSATQFTQWNTFIAKKYFSSADQWSTESNCLGTVFVSMVLIARQISEAQKAIIWALCSWSWTYT